MDSSPEVPAAIAGLPDVSHLVTEDDTPVDNLFSEKQMRLLVMPIYDAASRWANGHSFLATANVGLFFAVDEPPLVPDFLLSLDVKVPDDWWVKGQRSYFLWLYGKPPDVVLEIVSNREGGEGDSKLATYARIGVPYYVIFDPQQMLSDEVLRVFWLRQKVYEPITPEWLPVVNLGLTLWRGMFEKRDDVWLRWSDHNGQPLPTGAESAVQERQRAEQERLRSEEEHLRAEQERLRAEQEHSRAEQERLRAEQEHGRAEQEHGRAEKLAAQLRNLGIDPLE